MQEAVVTAPEEQTLTASGLSPGLVQKRLALAFALGIVAAYFIITKISDNVPRPVPGFVLTFVTAMFVCDSITAVLLFAQFYILRSLALLVLASAYIFTALILIPYTLSFPGVFILNEALVGGLQSAAGLYVTWHSGFPAFVLGYALLKDAESGKLLWRGSVGSGIALSLTATATIVAAAAAFCIVAEPLVPRMMADRLTFSSLYPYAVGIPDCSLSLCALVTLWIRRRSTLDLWLMVVMFFYAIDMPLSYFPAALRFSDGWYAVRFIAFFSSSLVLVVLLWEIVSLYAQLFGAVRAHRRERDARLITGDAVAATIAHEIKQPLSAMITRADTGFRLLDRELPEVDKVKTALRQISSDGHRAGAMIESIRANFKKDTRIRTPLDFNELIDEVLASLRDELRKHRIALKVEPAARLPTVVGDRVQMQQVLLNLITNAIDSMAAPEGARVLSVKSEIDQNGGVRISVADTGTGIEAQHVERIFNPLFTTKSDGMGMGLSICRSIIEAHDGHLSVVPNTPQGSVFQFALHPPEPAAT
jgi:signal transduction histidine kinase